MFDLYLADLYEPDIMSMDNQVACAFLAMNREYRAARLNGVRTMGETE